jgi:hypothetical protein
VVDPSWKWSLAVRHLSTLVFTLKETDIDLASLNKCPKDSVKPKHFEWNPVYPLWAYPVCTDTLGLLGLG